MGRRSFTPEFRLEAVKLVRLEDVVEPPGLQRRDLDLFESWIGHRSGGGMLVGGSLECRRTRTPPGSGENGSGRAVGQPTRR